MSALDHWIDRQLPLSAAAMLESVSPRAVKRRPGFGQVVVPRPGAIVASPVLGDYDPDPDYYYHWYRDSALVLDGVRAARDLALIDASLAQRRFEEFVDFNLALQALDGGALVAAPQWRERVAPDFVRYLRDDADLGLARGDAIAGETRVNADGRLDISKWPRPQHDGPALRGLAVLRWQGMRRMPDDAPTARLLRADIDYAYHHGDSPCYDMWEEQHARHYYPKRVSVALLKAGADWLDLVGESTMARNCRARAHDWLRALDEFADPSTGTVRSRLELPPEHAAKELDVAVIFATVHSDAARGVHSVADPRLCATLDALEHLFASAYPINRDLPPGRRPALGRYAGDRYFSGGAYYFSTLAAAEFCYLAAQAAAARTTASDAARGTDAAEALFARGDGFLETVRAYTPASGALSEQFDQSTGAQTSAKQLAWSHAALITAVAARRAALRRRAPARD